MMGIESIGRFNGLPRGITLTGYTPSTICSAKTPDADLPALGGTGTPTKPVSPLARTVRESDPPLLFKPSPEISRTAHIGSMEEYQAMYQRSIQDPEGFWGDMARTFEWFTPPQTMRQFSFDARIESGIDIRFFEGGKTNITVNCLDRYAKTTPNKIAIIWEGNEPGEVRKISYKELLADVSRFANVLKSQGVEKGDRVTLYMPMVPELAVAMLACARIGAIHSIVFGGFSADSLAGRITDAKSRFLITSDGLFRGKKIVPLKDIADKAISMSGDIVKTCIVLNRTNTDVTMRAGRDLWWDDVMWKASPECKPAVMDAEDPLFILYTSGSTGKPKGLLHSTGGYMVYTGTTFKYVFDYKPEDVYWCTADIGWITGHSYIVYGPLSQGATTVMFEGVPTYPDAGRFWDVVERHKVNQFYTAPTAIRALMGTGDEFPAHYDLSKLRVLGTVGEPINPAAWKWYNRNIGNGRVPIVDTYWQTETGGFMLTPFPGATPTKPGSATLPFFGVEPAIVDSEGKEIEGPGEGRLVMKAAWPGMARTIYGDHKRYAKTYFSDVPRRYFTGDGARRDEDGYYWITGRVDDVINVSGHRMGTAEVESALVAHAAVSEAAVVGYPHDIKGQSIYAYVTLTSGTEPTPELKAELVKQVREIIGPIASPDAIQFAPGLPKTRSGKIMRRILRKLAAGTTDKRAFGDISTLADPMVVDGLIESWQEPPKLVRDI